MFQSKCHGAICQRGCELPDSVTAVQTELQGEIGLDWAATGDGGFITHHCQGIHCSKYIGNNFYKWIEAAISFNVNQNKNKK